MMERCLLYQRTEGRVTSALRSRGEMLSKGIKLSGVEFDRLNHVDRCAAVAASFCQPSVLPPFLGKAVLGFSFGVHAMLLAGLLRS